MRQRILFSIVLLSILLVACQPELENNIVIYENDFETEDLDDIFGGVVTNFNGSKVIGNYNLGGFTLHLDGLPDHNYVAVMFDLYIHDSWDGNQEGVGGPDIWGMELDEWVFLREKADRQLLFETTFSNSVCNVNYCLVQAFPEQLPSVKNPKTGAFSMNLPGVCMWAGDPQGSTHYRIEKVFAHSGAGMALKFYDRLNQSNSSNPKCDESWSMDNIRIRAIHVR